MKEISMQKPTLCVSEKELKEYYNKYTKETGKIEIAGFLLWLDSIKTRCFEYCKSNNTAEAHKIVYKILQGVD
jgi:hypothetical protein